MSTRFQNGIVCSCRGPMGCVYFGKPRALISSRDNVMVSPYAFGGLFYFKSGLKIGWSYFHPKSIPLKLEIVGN